MFGKDLEAMVIDDHQTMRQILREYLKKMGVVRVSDFVAVEPALDALTTRKVDPDFIICDLYLEEGGCGMDFVNRLRRKTTLKKHHSNVILLTSEKDPLILEVCSQVGARIVLTKPCKLQELSEAISRIVGFQIAAGAPPLVQKVFA